MRCTKLNRDGRHVIIGRPAAMPDFLAASFSTLSAGDAVRPNYLRRRPTEALDVFREARAANLTALREAEAGDCLLAGVQKGSAGGTL